MGGLNCSEKNRRQTESGSLKAFTALRPSLSHFGYTLGPPQRQRRIRLMPTLSAVPEAATLLATILTGEPVTHGALTVIPSSPPTSATPSGSRRRKRATAPASPR